MKTKSILILFSVAALTACSTNNINSGNEANGEENDGNNEGTSEMESGSDGGNKSEERTNENEQSNDDAVKEESESNENEGSHSVDELNETGSEANQADNNTAVTPESIIEVAIEAQAQLESFSLEWTYHDIDEDGVVLEARDYELLHYYKNNDGADYFYRDATGSDEEGNAFVVQEAQTPAERIFYRDLDNEVVIMDAGDEYAPPVARLPLENLFLSEDSDFELTYEGIFEIDGYKAHHIHAISESENVETNMWFDTTTGLQVRQSEYYVGHVGTVSRLTMIETDIEFDESMFEFTYPTGVQVRENNE